VYILNLSKLHNKDNQGDILEQSYHISSVNMKTTNIIKRQHTAPTMTVSNKAPSEK